MTKEDFTKPSPSRSYNMSQIRSRDTKPELYFRKLLFHEGLRYRIAPKYIYGKPDVYLRKYNTAIFIHGCFWHRHKGCRYSTTPKNNQAFWEEKFEKNQKRDETVLKTLLEDGVRVVIVWECKIKEMQKNRETEEKVVEEVLAFLEDDCSFLEIE